LAAGLQERGYDVTIKDLNLQAILWLLRPDRLAEARTRVALRRKTLMSQANLSRASGVPLSADDRYGLWRSLIALRCGNGFPEMVGQAVDALRDPDLFYQPTGHRAARAIIDAALDLQALACDERLHVSLCPQQYNGRYRATSLSDLYAATEEREGNIFLPFFEQVAIPELLDHRPRLVGISISNVFQVIPGITLARLLHDLRLFVVIGGPFFSKFGLQLAAMPEFFDLCDAVAIGEGEKTLLALAEALVEDHGLSGVPNLIFRDGNQTVTTPLEVSPWVPDPGAADFRTLPLEQYFSPEPVLPIYAGKGCSWSRCTFCEIPQINQDFGRLRRVRHPRRVVEEMRAQWTRHRARHFVFTDECLEPWLLAGIAEAIEEIGLDVHYLGYTRFSEALDRQFCERLARSGCRKLLIGLESGCQAVNDQCQKGVDLTRVPAIVEACQKAGIAVHIFSIVGLPGEGKDEANESAEYLSQLVQKLDLPASTLDVSPFYLNWNSWLRRNAYELGINYQTGQDFPLHVEDYSLDYGMDSQTAKTVAEEVYRRLCWESSALGFEIGYRNPVWPGWEEYTLLYLSRYPRAKDRNSLMWPFAEKDLLDKTVTVTEALILHHLPFSLDTLAKGTCDGVESMLALAPAADLVKVTDRSLKVISRRSKHRVGDLVNELYNGSDSDKDRADALVEVVRLIYAGILEWCV